MRLIYAQGFSKNEKEEWRCIIFNNILSAFRQVMEAMDEMGIEFDSDFNTVRSVDPANWQAMRCRNPQLHLEYDS